MIKCDEEGKNAKDAFWGEQDVELILKHLM